jgi:hypothetical protein
MTTKIVQSENPLEHWSDIEGVDGKIVLDLGCGWLFQPFESTPQYFISRGAKKVIGVDASCGEIDKLNQVFPDHLFVCKTILEFDDLASLIVENRPQLIKMDIEGYESHMKDITEDQFKSVDEIAVEYHNPACKKILEDKLTELGFEIFAINQFGWFCTDINQMGIMHSKRIK